MVKSKTFGLLQHDPYTWLVTGNHLVRADRLYERRQQRDNNLNQWILSLNEQQACPGTGVRNAMLKSSFHPTMVSSVPRYAT